MYKVAKVWMCVYVCGVVLRGKLLEFIIIIILLYIKEEITVTSNLYYSEFHMRQCTTDSDADWLPSATAAEFNCRTVRCSLAAARPANRILATLVY